MCWVGEALELHRAQTEGLWETLAASGGGGGAGPWWGGAAPGCPPLRPSTCVSGAASWVGPTSGCSVPVGRGGHTARVERFPGRIIAGKLQGAEKGAPRPRLPAGNGARTSAGEPVQVLALCPRSPGSRGRGMGSGPGGTWGGPGGTWGPAPSGLLELVRCVVWKMGTKRGLPKVCGAAGRRCDVQGASASVPSAGTRAVGAAAGLFSARC